MFIVWGKKLVYRKLGFVADFCPICRAIRAFELKRVGSASHVYYITSGEGELVGFERTCKGCATVFNADPSTYTTVAKKLLPVSELKAQTFPNADLVFKERFEIERKVKSDPLSFAPEERKALIRSPFVLLSPKVERRFAATHLDKEIGLALIGAIALLITGPGIAHAIAPEADNGMVVLFFLALGLALVAWQVIASSGRFMRREILPVLASALLPLKPTDSELSSVVSELKQLRHKIGKKIKLADLRAYLSQPSRLNQ